MKNHYAFFYIMKKDPDKIGELAPCHIKYWEDNRPLDYQGGPFSDKSGGLIVFKASGLDTARNLALNDPFILKGVIRENWVKEWMLRP